MQYAALIFATSTAMTLATAPAFSQSAQELALIKQVFAQIQPLSFKNNREYCGYVGFDADGKLTASKAKKGRKGSCQANDPDNIEVITASYHTHGGFAPGYASETPSVSDIEGDEAEGIDGWVGTPGGRLWYVDTDDMAIREVCSVGCLAKDPKFDPDDMPGVESHYTYDDLVTFMADQ